MKATELKSKSKAELNTILLQLLKERLNLRMQKSISENSKPHLLRNARKNIARVKTALAYLKTSIDKTAEENN